MSSTPSPARHDGRPHRSGRHLFWTVESIGTALLLVAVLGITWQTWDTDHTTVRALEEHEPPQTLSGQGWEWQAPEDAEVIAFHPLPSGLAVRLDDGIVALDGATGEQTWHYRRSDAPLASLGGTPEQDRLALSFETGGQGAAEAPGDEEDEAAGPDARSLVVLDTATGKVVTEQPVEAGEETMARSDPAVGAPEPALDVSGEQVRELTGEARLVNAFEPERIEARSLDDDSVLWSQSDAFRREKEGRAEGGGEEGVPADEGLFRGRAVVSGSIVVLGFLWQDLERPNEYAYRVTGVDAETGQLLWERSWPLDADSRHPGPALTVGGGSVFLRFSPQDRGLLLGLKTGREKAEELWPASGGLAGVTERGYVTVDGSGATGVLHAFGHDGGHLSTLSPAGLAPDLERTMTLPTDEAFVALQPHPGDPGRGLLTVDLWETGERSEEIPVDVAPEERRPQAESYGLAGGSSAHLRQVPGAIALLDPAEGRVLGFTP